MLGLLMMNVNKKSFENNCLFFHFSYSAHVCLVSGMGFRVRDSSGMQHVCFMPEEKRAIYQSPSLRKTFVRLLRQRRAQESDETFFAGSSKQGLFVCGASHRNQNTLD